MIEKVDADSGQQTGQHPDQMAMQDEDIARRLDADPTDSDAQLDHGLDESMDASDVPSALQPGSSGEPAPSSGYDEDEEARLLSER